jgi:hypothetical protein
MEKMVFFYHDLDIYKFEILPWLEYWEIWLALEFYSDFLVDHLEQPRNT